MPETNTQETPQVEVEGTQETAQVESAPEPDLSKLSYNDLQALLAGKRKEMEAEKDAARELVQEQLVAVTQGILQVQPCEPSAKATVPWVGSSLGGFEVTIDDRTYRVQVSITDVAATEARKPQAALAKAAEKVREATKAS